LGFLHLSFFLRPHNTRVIEKIALLKGFHDESTQGFIRTFPFDYNTLLSKTTHNAITDVTNLEARQFSLSSPGSFPYVREMRKFVYKFRKDKLSMLNIEQIDKRIRVLAKMLALCDPAKIAIIASRVYAIPAAKKFGLP
jgi:hypothetical protein